MINVKEIFNLKKMRLDLKGRMRLNYSSSNFYESVKKNDEVCYFQLHRNWSKKVNYPLVN